MLTLMLVISQAKALTLNEALDFHMNFVRERWIGVDKLNMAKKKDFIVNKLEEDNNQTLISRIDLTSTHKWERI